MLFAFASRTTSLIRAGLPPAIDRDRAACFCACRSGWVAPRRRQRASPNNDVDVLRIDDLDLNVARSERCLTGHVIDSWICGSRRSIAQNDLNEDRPKVG